MTQTSRVQLIKKYRAAHKVWIWISSKTRYPGYLVKLDLFQANYAVLTRNKLYSLLS